MSRGISGVLHWSIVLSTWSRISSNPALIGTNVLPTEKSQRVLSNGVLERAKSYACAMTRAVKREDGRQRGRSTKYGREVGALDPWEDASPYQERTTKIVARPSRKGKTKGRIDAKGGTHKVRRSPHKIEEISRHNHPRSARSSPKPSPRDTRLTDLDSTRRTTTSHVHIEVIPPPNSGGRPRTHDILK